MFARPWKQDIAAASDTLDETFGEPFAIIPALERKDVNVQALPDFAHRHDTVGVFTQPFHEGLTTDGRHHEKGLSVASSAPFATFSRRNLAWAVQHEDFVLRRCDQTLWQVKKVRPDGVARIAVDLNLMGVPSQ